MTVGCEIPILDGSTAALGFFDGLHTGHAAVINSARREDVPLAVLSIGANENAKHIISEQMRRDLLGDMGAQYLITPPFDDIRSMSGEQFVSDVLCDRLHAARVSCGYNYRFGAGASCGADDLRRLCEKRGIECVILPPVRYRGKAVSSTRIREALTQGDMQAVSRMLGRPYSYKLRVIGGQHLGRTLGTPTINQLFPDDMLQPRHGVYASITVIDGRPMYSVTNIGVRPTVGAEQPLSETWIPEYSGDLYDRSIEVRPMRFMRQERKFSSIDELRAAIIKDGKKAGRLMHRYCSVK